MLRTTCLAISAAVVVMAWTAPTAEAANGCGRGFFRTIDGQCLPNERFRVGPGRVAAPPPCPRGYQRDPDPARPICYPVF